MLNAYYDKIKDWETVCYQEAEEADPRRGIEKGQKVLDPFLETLVFATMIVDLGEVTEKNIDEWRFRLTVLYVMGIGTFQRMVEDGTAGIVLLDEKHYRIETYLPTADRLRTFIGLRTNVGDKTRNQFMTRAKDMLRARAQEELR